MCLKILYYTFAVISVLFTVQLITLMTGVTKKMKPMQASNYVSCSAIFLFMYLINAALIMWFAPMFHLKLIMAICMTLPFIIGKIVTYPRLKFFSVFQILCVIMSGVYLLII